MNQNWLPSICSIAFILAQKGNQQERTFDMIERNIVYVPACILKKLSNIMRL